MSTRTFFLSGAVLAMASIAGTVTAGSPCTGAPHCSVLGGSAAVVGGPMCQSGPKIHVCYRGPVHYPEHSQQSSCFGDDENAIVISTLPGCSGGSFRYEASLLNGERGFRFHVGYAGYQNVETGSFTCAGDDGCSGGFMAFLFPTDEPPEIRSCTQPNAPPNSNPPPPNVGLPVNLITGNVWFDQTDAAMPGRGRGLGFTRSYNSSLALRDVGGAFGRGWFHPYEQALSFPRPEILKLRLGDGSPLWFEDTDSNGTFVGMLPRLESSWFTVSGGVYTRHFKEGGTETYDSAGRFTGSSDEFGNAVSIQYDASGRIETITESGGGRALTLAHDSAGRLTALSGPAGPIATYLYDSSSRLQSVRYPDGTGFNFAYSTSAGLISLVTDAAGRVVERHAYDSQGRGITSELADGVEKLTLYYMTGATLVADANGNVTEYEWSHVGGVTPRVTRITGPGCAGCSGGSPGRVGQWQYDEMGRIVSHTNGLGKTWQFTYDGDGDLVGETDPLNNTAIYTHDSQGRVLSVTRPDGGVTTYTHGDAGPLTITEKVNASQNRTATLTYTSTGRLETITDPRSKVTTLAYETDGDLASVSDSLSHATTFGYDAMGRRTTVTDALTNATTTTYDARGSRQPRHQPRHHLHRVHLRRLRPPGERDRPSAADDALRLRRLRPPGARSRTLAAATATYGYDAMSNLTSLTDANGNTTGFAYDIYNRVSAVTYPGGALETFTYDLGGRLKTKTHRKGTVTTYTYDDAGRLLGKSYSDGTPAVSYTYDSVGRLLTAANGSDTLNWTYDLAGQVLSEESDANSSTVSYTYDLAGNRLA